jgi:hypothetical protein
MLPIQNLTTEVQHASCYKFTEYGMFSELESGEVELLHFFIYIYKNAVKHVKYVSLRWTNLSTSATAGYSNLALIPKSCMTANECQFLESNKYVNFHKQSS